MPNKKIKRSVAFWQFVKAPDLTPLGEIDWPEFMAEVATRARRGQSNRFSVNDDELHGKVYTRDVVDHLVLTKDRDDVPRQQNRSTGDVETLITNDEGWTVVESSFVALLGFGNVFGVLQSQISAPSPQAIARWINATNILDDKVAVEAVVDPARWDHLRRAGAVTMLEFAGPAAALNRDVTGPIEHLLRPARFGDFEIRVKIKAKRTRSEDAARKRRELYEATEALARQVGVENLNTAKVKIFDEDRKTIGTSSINLIKQRFTTQRNIELTSGADAAVTEVSAFDAILGVAEKLDADLRAAVRRDPTGS